MISRLRFGAAKSLLPCRNVRRFADIAETVPQPTRIAGTWLRPFCLGHHMLFKRMELPFAGNAMAEVSIEDVITGVMVCAGVSYEWTLSAMLDGSWNRVVEQWRRDARGPWYRRRRVDWKEATETFQDYLIDGYTVAPTWRYNDKSEISLSTPWELMLTWRLINKGFSETQVLNAYLPSLWYHYFALAELRQLEHVKEAKAWRKIFMTESDARQLDKSMA